MSLPQYCKWFQRYPNLILRKPMGSSWNPNLKWYFDPNFTPWVFRCKFSGLFERSLDRKSANQTYPQMYRFIKATERHPLILVVVFKTWMKSCDAGFRFRDVFPPTGTRWMCSLPAARAPNAGRQAPQQKTASSFNLSFNYGGRMNRRRPRRQGTLPYSQGGSRRTSCTVTSASCSPAAEYYKDVILLPSLTWMKVPNDKSQLQKRGCYVDAVRF